MTHVPAVLGAARTAVRPAIRAAVERLESPLREVVGYHFGWLDERGRPHDGGAGKGLRPALALLGARAAGGSDAEAIPPAVAVELVHNSSLVHDDLIDGDGERHHRPTVWTVFGMPAAVLAGDALLTLAHETVVSDGGRGEAAGRTLATATRRMLTGQAVDISFERRADVGVDECVAMAEAKTAALLSAACALGSVWAGGSPALTAALGAYGRHLGLAFQFVDDLLGIWGTQDVTGKPVLADLRTRKKSLPVVYALRSTGSEATELAAAYARPDLDEDGLHRCADLVEAAGGRDWAEREATARLDLALGALDTVPLARDVRDDLVEVARYVTERTR